ncbi:hypothetical protein DFO77_107120 [Marinilabilia salmonicolor]|jgi:transcriptional regulator with XRE-family HTH domain|uniref:HTH cro/C1-type domain-containing protein n=1 Tax=Marinilabilia salmonicolor TaxID=989 RepID=A0A2T0XEP4_9BACT|nr:hypothetical protein BY457_11226 [Marinilabilia salmonicolor]RCW36829.1 hypothetical protein DFO77_107120 [Marinilabilia salmonicolor]
MQDNIYEKSGAELISEVGRRYRDYRKRMGLTQKEVSHKSGITTKLENSATRKVRASFPGKG